MTPEIVRRLKALKHWQAHGLASALDAFEISRSSPVRLSPKGKPKPIKQPSVLRKPKDLKLQACQCLAFDTIVRQRDGMKRYILTAIDPVTHLAFAYAPQTAASHHAACLHHSATIPTSPPSSIQYVMD